MRFLNLIPEWAQPVFKEAGLELNFEELKMDCATCTFAKGDIRDGVTALETYSSAVKCCSFFPDLANFSAGFELRKNSSIFDGLLANESSALPLGIMATDSYKATYSKSEFGQSEDLLCPHFDRTNSNCSIWKSRPSACVRFVCKSSLGMNGQTIWGHTETALHALEQNLAYEAALQLGLVNYEIYSREWSASGDEKKAFYLSCAAYVDSLTPIQKIDIAGEGFADAGRAIQSMAGSIAPRAASSPSVSIMIASSQ